ncbi:MAG: DUF2262 domain-containing protein [Oscillospiraceae bacterium]|nr:DUF2262 domain-containing protein [Oscillospiraceae bacterium]
MMEIKDFNPSEIFSVEGDTLIWGEKVGIGVDCDGSNLENMIPMINRLIEFIDSNKGAVVKALVDDGMLELAEDWASSAEEAEDSTEEHECYIMEDGSKVYFPITEEDFAASLHFDGISVYYDDDNDDISASVYLVCQPDYFAYHCIEIFMDSKGNVDVNGLAG